MAIKDNIRKIRLLKKYSQKDIENKTGIHNRQVQMYESGKITPKDENLRKLAHGLDVDIWALRDIDIDADNPESIAQLFFQLEEKGLFDIHALKLARKDEDKEQYYLRYPIDRETALLIKQWKLIDSMSIDIEEKGHITYEDWKYDREKRKLANEAMQKVIQEFSP